MEKIKKSFLFATTIIISQVTFAQWNRAIGINDRFVYSIRKIDSYLFAAANSGAYLSSDGINWQMKINGMDATVLKSVFPNPTCALLNLRLNDRNITQIDIVDILGHKVYSTKIIGKTLSIDIGTLTKGIYFIKVTSKNGKAYLTEKIIKN